MAQKTDEKRAALIQAAIALFYAQGFHATGIDLIAQQAGVSKRTMYSYFRSKEALIAAALSAHDEAFSGFFRRSVEQLPGSPLERLLGIFDVAHVWFSEQGFQGCLFISAANEYDSIDSPIHEACVRYKESMCHFIESLAIEAAVPEPAVVARSMSILLEGAIVTAQISGDPSVALHAKAAARQLLASQLIEE